MEKQNEVKLVHYTGTKTIQACPMSKWDAEKELGRTLNSKHSTEGEDEPGYLVVYPDGYRSWSPATLFEGAYHRTESFVDRLYLEASELKDKVEKLSKFINYNDAYKRLPVDVRVCMEVQCQDMMRYLADLRKRIFFAENQQSTPGTHEEG